MRGNLSGSEFTVPFSISLKLYKISENARLLLTNRAKEYIIDINTRYCADSEIRTLYLVFSAFTILPANAGREWICCIF